MEVLSNQIFTPARRKQRDPMAKKENIPVDQAAVHLIFGDNDLKRSETAREVVDTLCPPESQSLGLETISGECGNSDRAVTAVKETMQALQTVGFLGEGKTVWLKDVDFIGTNPVSKAAAVKEVLAALSKLIENGLPQGCHLLISAEKVFKGSAFYKSCVKHARVEELKIASRPKQRDQDARAQAAQLFEQNGVKVSRQVLETFIARCGADGHQVAGEVEKLVAYLGDEDTLSSDDIAVITTPAAEAEYWELGDAIAKRQTVRALKLLREQMYKGDSAVRVIAGFERTIQQLLLTRECMRSRVLSVQGNKPHWRDDPQSRELLDSVFSDSRNDLRKMHSFRVAMLSKDAQRYSRAELRRGLHNTIATHEMLVSRSLPEFMLLEMLIVKITAG